LEGQVAARPLGPRCERGPSAVGPSGPQAGLARPNEGGRRMSLRTMTSIRGRPTDAAYRAFDHISAAMPTSILSPRSDFACNYKHLYAPSATVDFGTPRRRFTHLYDRRDRTFTHKTTVLSVIKRERGGQSSEMTGRGDRRDIDRGLRATVLSATFVPVFHPHGHRAFAHPGTGRSPTFSPRITALSPTIRPPNSPPRLRNWADNYDLKLDLKIIINDGALHFCPGGKAS
jgi:hypothetical protein